ncbi:MAG: SHOCT domain-containing protein [Acidimicrobiales bacterium]|nr:SHOCT domain-containing protein [Acidimicrobiales bacterium]
MQQAVFAITVICALVFGLGATGVGIAWLNDKRLGALGKPGPGPTPRDILEARFATGEIDEAEFNRRMNRLLLGPPLELD